MELYAVRNTKTGKLVTNLTSSRKKFWESKTWALDAIRRAMTRRWYKGDPFELVTFRLVEVENEEN